MAFSGGKDGWDCSFQRHSCLAGNAAWNAQSDFDREITMLEQAKKRHVAQMRRPGEGTLGRGMVDAKVNLCPESAIRRANANKDRTG